VSRHLNQGYLNFCGFNTILPTLRKCIEASPNSPAAEQLQAEIDKKLRAYQKLREKHGLDEENRDRLLKMVADYFNPKS